jgi:hypothetical protein
MRRTNPMAISMRNGRSAEKAEVRAAVPAAVDTATVST